MKKIIVCLLLILSVSFNMAANRDSLINLIKTNQNLLSENQILDVYYELGSSFNSDRIYAEALKYLREGLSKSDDEKSKARFYHKIGNVFVDSTNYKLGLENLNKALVCYKRNDNTEKLSSVANLMGMCYGLTNNLDEAINSFKEALEYNKELSDTGGVAQSYFNIGLANYFQGKYDQATFYYIESLKCREKLNDTTSLVASLTALGETLRIRKKYDEAMKYYSRALSLKQGIKLEETMAYIYSEIGLLYKYQKNYEKSIPYLDTALTISEKGKYKRGIATLYTYKAGIFKEQKKYDSALELYNKSITRYKEIGFDVGIAQSEIAIAEILISKGKLRQAAELIKSAEKKASANHLLEEQTEAARLKYLISKKIGKPSGLRDLENYITLKDSLFNINKEKQISEIETKYETEKKEERIKFLNQETKIQQSQLRFQKYLIAGIIIIVVLVIGFTILFIRQNKLKSEVKIEQSRFRLLRSQMNPHFIYNALSAIQSIVLKNKPMDSAGYISGFSKLMRQVLEHSREDLISLEEEIEFLENYLKLQQLRFNNKFNYEIIYDEGLLGEEILLPPMLSQPAVENAVEHGMRQLENETGDIKVIYKIENNLLDVKITDNGPGIKTVQDEKDKDHKSLATKITKERIQNIKKLINIDIQLNISELNRNSANKGTVVNFKIPQRKYD